MLDLLKDILPVSMDILAVVLFIYIILLPFIAAWRLFKKAGIPGWKALIPVYSSYLMFKIVGMPAIISTIVYASYIIINNIVKDITKEPNYLVIIFVLISATYMVFDIIKAIKLGKVFGKGIFFTIGLILLGPIFEIILGMGKSKYIGDYKKVENN